MNNTATVPIRIFDRLVQEEVVAGLVGDRSLDWNRVSAFRMVDLASFHHWLCMVGFGENGHIAFNDPPSADFADAPAGRKQQIGEGHSAITQCANRVRRHAHAELFLDHCSASLPGAGAGVLR